MYLCAHKAEAGMGKEGSKNAGAHGGFDYLRLRKRTAAYRSGKASCVFPKADY